MPWLSKTMATRTTAAGRSWIPKVGPRPRVWVFQSARMWGLSRVTCGGVRRPCGDRGLPSVLRTAGRVARRTVGGEGPTLDVENQTMTQ